MDDLKDKEIQLLIDYHYRNIEDLKSILNLNNITYNENENINIQVQELVKKLIKDLRSKEHGINFIQEQYKLMINEKENIIEKLTKENDNLLNIIESKNIEIENVNNNNYDLCEEIKRYNNIYKYCCYNYKDYYNNSNNY